MIPEFTEEDHQTNRDILTRLVATAPSDVANILICYNYDRDADEIYNQLNRFKKQDLQQAANHLDQLPKTHRYKEQLIKGIISRIDSLLLEVCSKCEEKFSVEIDDTPPLTCVHCGQGCHAECYEDIVELIKTYPGIHYQCRPCERKYTSPKDAIPPSQENEDIENSQPLNPQPTPKKTPTFSRHRDSQDDRFHDERPTCELLRRGKCPHGISGRTLVNGEICQFAHPRRCMRFCRNGPYSRHGCDQGRECQYLHPILCKYSLKYKQCTNLRCRFTHLTGTTRYKSNSDPYYTEENDAYHQHEDYNPNSRLTHQTHLPTGQPPNTTPQPPVRNTPTREQHTAMNPFLESLPGILSQIHQEIKQLKLQQRVQPEPPTPHPPPNTAQNLNPLQIQPPQPTPTDQNLKFYSQMLLKPTATSNVQFPAIPQHQIFSQNPNLQ